MTASREPSVYDVFRRFAVEPIPFAGMLSTQEAAEEVAEIADVLAWEERFRKAAKGAAQTLNSSRP